MSFVIATLGSVLIVAIAFPVHSLTFSGSVIQVLAAFILGTLSFAAIGFLLGAILPSPRAAQGLGLILFFVMLILGGAGPPPEVLTGALDFIGNITPLRHVIYLIQDPWLGFGWNGQASLITTGILVVAAVLSARFFRWD